MKGNQGRREERAIAISLILLTCVAAWLLLLTAQGNAETLSVGVKVGLPSTEASGFVEAFLPLAALSANLGLGVQTAAVTLSTWVTLYFLGPPSTRLLAPYGGAGLKLARWHTGRSEAFLMVLGGLRINPAFLAPFSVGIELALLPKLPGFDRMAWDARLLFAFGVDD